MTRRTLPVAGAAWGLLATALLASGSAHAEVELNWRGTLMSDVRLALHGDVRFERLESTAHAHLGARLSRHVAAVADVRLIWSETGDPQDFTALTDRSRLDPFRWESDALFVEFFNLGLEGLDLRVGRQQVIWGAADRFHAVSHLNPLDLEDPLAFGEVIANEMILLAFRPDLSVGGDEDEGIDPWLDEIALQLAVVPFFKPAQLPESGRVVFTEQDVFAHRANTPLAQELVRTQDALIRNNGWDFIHQPSVATPDRDLSNAMIGARLSARVLGVDLGLSYFNGFDDMPRAAKIEADTTALPEILVDIRLTYPRVQVFGVDMATSLDFLGGMGLWAEVGVTVHDDLYRVVSTGPAVGVNEIEVEYPGGSFVKAVVGVDYTPVEWLYLNVQYLHGFVDEFGDDMLYDYVVAGGDVKLGRDAVLLRLFNIISLQDGSFVLYPQLVFRPWQGGDISIGGLVYSSAFGGWDERKKFDSRATGGSMAFLRLTARL